MVRLEENKRIFVTVFCALTEDLAAALPCLESLNLGIACRRNTCATTIASLLSMSVHCLDLTDLEIHFNTVTIVGDIQRLLDGGAGRDKHWGQRGSYLAGTLRVF